MAAFACSRSQAVVEEDCPAESAAPRTVPECYGGPALVLAVVLPSIWYCRLLFGSLRAHQRNRARRLLIMYVCIMDYGEALQGSEKGHLQA